MKETNPFKSIGLKLKQLREQANQSLIEVSGAIEIEPKLLEQFEAGHKLPDEDILMTLISYFKVPESESYNILEMAGYGFGATNKGSKIEEQILKQVMMVIPIDNRVAYSDRTVREANKNGVVLNFLLGDSGQVVSRVGMSNDTAHQLVISLVDQLKKAQQPKIIKSISAGSQKSSPKKPK